MPLYARCTLLLPLACAVEPIRTSLQTVDYLVFVMEYCGGGEFYQSASNGPRFRGCTCAAFAVTAHSMRQNVSTLRFWLTLLGALMNEPAQRQMAESDVRFYIAEARCLAHRCLAGRSGLCGGIRLLFARCWRDRMPCGTYTTIVL